MTDLPADPFLTDFVEVARCMWEAYTAAVTELMAVGFTEDQAKELAYAAVLSSVQGARP